MSRKREAEIGEFYISANKRTIREITGLDHEYDRVLYRSYQSTASGYVCSNPEHEYQCTRSAFFNWAAAKAPPKVVAKLDVEGIRETARKLREDHKRNTILNALKDATDIQIAEEYKRRGLSETGFDMSRIKQVLEGKS